MVSGIHRLEETEKQEEEELKATMAQQDDGTIPQPKKRKTQEDLARRARQVCIRLASMANRCYWLSACEVTVHILTGGDCLQSHNNQRLFTRQLQWAMQHCKRQLNHEAARDDMPQKEQSVQAVAMQVRMPDKSDGGALQPAQGYAEDGDVEIVDMHACITSTNISDDFAHRGSRLRTMPFYVYRVYVRRILKPARARAKGPTIFVFDEHYQLLRNYVQ
ncbi:hypothetical protein N9L19_00465 [bacterium]|nr:hypothetical protein [bacterium]